MSMFALRTDGAASYVTVTLSGDWQHLGTVTSVFDLAVPHSKGQDSLEGKSISHCHESVHAKCTANRVLETCQGNT